MRFPAMVTRESAPAEAPISVFCHGSYPSVTAAPPAAPAVELMRSASRLKWSRISNVKDHFTVLEFNHSEPTHPTVSNVTSP